MGKQRLQMLSALMCSRWVNPQRKENLFSLHNWKAAREETMIAPQLWEESETRNLTVI